MKTKISSQTDIKSILVYFALTALFLLSINISNQAQIIKNFPTAESVKNLTVKNSEAIPNLLRIKATTALSSDETVVYFRNDVTEGFDPEFDAYKLTGGADAPQLGSITQDQIKLSINALPCVECGRIIPIYFSLNQVSPVTFLASSLETFTMDEPIFLEDLQENKMINLKQEPSYTFTYQPPLTNRFQLIFLSYTPVTDQPSDKVSLYFNAGKLHVEIPSMDGQKAVINTFDIAGRLMNSATKTLTGMIQVDAPRVTGVYIVRILAGNKVFTRRIIVD
jgi:hypothetical protein